MSSQLQITTSLGPDGLWVITAQINSGGTLPKDIFMYENTGTMTLGLYQGVANLGEYQRLQTFTGSVIPIFGNKYVKYTQAKIEACPPANVQSVVTNIQTNVTNLSTAFQSQTSTTNIYIIP